MRADSFKPMTREVVTALGVGVHEIETHVLDRIFGGRRRIVGRNGDVIAAIDAERLGGVEGAGIERR